MRQPNIRQLRAFQFLTQGYSRRQALIKAGYSLSTANQAIRVFKSRKMSTLVTTFKNKLINAGLTTDYAAGKIIEWIDAKKIENGVRVPDYDVQLRAGTIYFTLIRETPKTQNAQFQNITLDDWIMAD